MNGSATANGMDGMDLEHEFEPGLAMASVSQRLQGNMNADLLGGPICAAEIEEEKLLEPQDDDEPVVKIVD